MLSLYIRGINLVQIGRQLGVTESTARKAFNRVTKRLPKTDVELLRKLESERIADLRQRLWADLAGKPDPSDPTKTIRLEGETLATLINAVLRISQREADLYGLDAPKKSDITSTVMGQEIGDEILDEQLARLTPQERQTFMMLVAKLQGRFVEEPAAIEEGSVETTATTVQSNGAGS